MSSRVLLITGATGNQGGAVVDALLASNTVPAPTILAVTRNPDSPSAKKLAAKSSTIKLLKGDLADPAPLFRTAREVTSQPVWGVFSVQTPYGATTDAEEKQGKALIDESLKNGVKHFVQTSVDRGGDEKSWSNETEVPHFASKHRIELYLRDEAAKASMSWTILRPVAFMDNLQPGFQTRVFITALQNKLKQKPLQLVAVKDIGIFGANALLDSTNSVYKNKAIGLAGDTLNTAQIVQIFKDKSTSAPAPTMSFLGSALLWGVKEVGLMVNWFDREGYGAEIAKCKDMNPKMMSMGDWVEQSNWPKK